MSQVSFELRGDVALIQMDDGKANALSPSLIAEVDAALDRAAKEAKATVLTGRPGKLSAGFDLKVMMSGADAATALFLAGAELYLKMYAHPQPVVAACTGHAIAGGVLLLAAADVRIGAEGAFKIGLNELAIGVPLPIFAHALAADRLDPRRFFEATLGATLYDPAGAKDVGWLDEVTSPDATVDRALEEAGRLSKLGGVPFQLSKATMRAGTIAHIRATLDDDLATIVERMSL